MLLISILIGRCRDGTTLLLKQVCHSSNYDQDMVSHEDVSLMSCSFSWETLLPLRFNEWLWCSWIIWITLKAQHFIMFDKIFCVDLWTHATFRDKGKCSCNTQSHDGHKNKHEITAQFFFAFFSAAFTSTHNSFCFWRHPLLCYSLFIRCFLAHLTTSKYAVWALRKPVS